MGKFFTGYVAVLFTVVCLVGSVNADRIDDAIALSKSTNRPLLAIGGAEFCGPCRKLHKTIETDQQLQPILEDCVVLEMDSQTQEFRDFVQRFPADASMIPMVYVVLPSGNPIYAQSGGMTGSQLAGLLSEAVSYSRPAVQPKALLASAELSIPAAEIASVLQSAREQAQVGNLVQALHLVSPIADMDGDSELVVKARGYEAKLNNVISNWMSELGTQMENNESIHGAAYRIAELYVELPDHPVLQEQARKLLIRFGRRESTRVAVQQAKYLLKARYFEDKEDVRNAMENYSAAVGLDSLSPAASFAENRLSHLQEKQAAKMTVNIQ